VNVQPPPAGHGSPHELQALQELLRRVCDTLPAGTAALVEIRAGQLTAPAALPGIAGLLESYAEALCEAVVARAAAEVFAPGGTLAVMAVGHDDPPAALVAQLPRVGRMTLREHTVLANLAQLAAVRLAQMRLAASSAAAGQTSPEALLDALIEALPGAFFLLRQDGTMVRWNSSLQAVTGYTDAELRSLTPDRFVPEAQRGLILATLREVLELGVVRSLDAEIQLKSGECVPYHFHTRRVSIEGELHVLGVARDVSQRRLAERAIRQARDRLDLALSASGLAMWDWDLAQQRVYFNEGWARLLGAGIIAEATFPAETVLDWTHSEDQERFRAALADALKGVRESFVCEYRIPDERGDWIWVHSRGKVTQYAADGRAERMIGTSMNVTQRRKVEARAEFLATRDALTGLPNRVLLADRLEQAISAAARNQGSMAFMFIDLDRFKTINDSLGHAVGDGLLKRVAERLSACVRASDTVARLGGDEFAVILENLGHDAAEGARAVAEKMVTAMAMPVLVESHQLNTSCSAGISIYPTDGRDSATLMKNADVAMYHAKELGRNNYQFFSAEMNARAQERLATENYLRLALRRGELALYYQPKVDIASGRIVGAEALLRWQHPRKGLLSPGAFIQVAEESGLILPIGEWVLERACEQLAAWRDHMPGFRMAVNLSVGQIRDGERLYGAVAHALGGSGAAPEALELELTESLLMQSVKEKVALLNRLGELGVSLAIDDFGTGYSSLSYLKQLPVDSIKIDSSFIRDLETDPNDRAIVQAILAMAKSLDLATVAEGVESCAQLERLAALGCNEYQGFLFSRPLPPEEFAERFIGAAGR
jgi:diguanylate cyclase (GGDEF)-like protein/PAS domain S-box-containing protein